MLKQNGQTDEARRQKGLINAATALGLLLQKGRPGPARKLWHTYSLKYRCDLLDITDGIAHAHRYRHAADIFEITWSQAAQES